MKKFGEKRGLKPTKNYTEYVKLDRSAAVYVVSACDPLEFESKEWGFPLVGSFPYLGWFDLKSARGFAQGLKGEKAPSGLDWDVDLRGATAYSTLGWFRDAVLSTMISEGVDAYADMVNVVLHESVHATLYVKSQSVFNESVANFVADQLTQDYLLEKKGPGAPESEAYLKDMRDSEMRRRRFHETYVELDKLYGSPLSDEEKLSEKARILDALKQELGFKRDINNATLVQFKTYNTGEREFVALYEACGKDWKRFWKSLEELKLSKDYFKENQQEELAPVLSKLVAKGCP